MAQKTTLRIDMLDPQQWHLDGQAPSSTDEENREANGSSGKIVYAIPEGIIFENSTDEKVRFTLDGGLPVPKASNDEAIVGLWFDIVGSAIEGTGSIILDKNTPLPLDGEALIPARNRKKFRVSFECGAKSKVIIAKCEYEWTTEELDLTDQCSKEPEVLVVVPDYPSAANLYLSAFAHSRNRKYIEEGLNIQVISTVAGRNYQQLYEIDGVPVLVGRLQDLKKLISRKHYKVIVTHFVDKPHYNIFDGYITDEELIFICHGPETTFPMLPQVARPYFCKPLKDVRIDNEKIDFVRKYAAKDNVNWVFVADWQMNKSEELMGTTFKHKQVIHNTIDEIRFPYRQKIADDRKKILVLRRFDNVRYHSIDIVIRCIWELAKRPCFKDLQFEIIGDGELFPQFAEALKQFDNVTTTRTYVPNSEIHKVHARNGIQLIPSRHDGHAVSMGEAASSGLVVVGSNVTSNPYFMEDEVNHTLADPEDPIALADIIERLYNNPEEYLAISERLAKRTHTLCCAEKTAGKEVALIQKQLKVASEKWGTIPQVTPAENPPAPVLTIIVPAYNLQDFLPKCLNSLLRHRNAGKTEILIVNDGSTDDTLKVAKTFEEASPGVVRVIDKPNGGHGSTINRGIEEAKGAYTRIIDGDDWVIPEELARQIDFLERDGVDLMLTYGKHEYANRPDLTDIMLYPMLDDDRVYEMHELMLPLFGFDTYGPVLSTSTYRTSCLREANFKLSENKPYVDMEFNAFALRCVETVISHDLDIYRYFIGREGQTVQRAAWQKHHRNHRYIINNILETIHGRYDYPDDLAEFIHQHYLAQLIASQVFIYDQLCMWEEIDPFLEEIKRFPSAFEAAMNHIQNRDAESHEILKRYKAELEAHATKPIIKPNGKPRADKNDIPQPKSKIKRLARDATPYGLIMMRRDIREKRKS